jgi:phosphoglycolate phosphatase
MAPARRQRFLDHYAQHLLDDSRAFDGVETLLEALQGHGLPWGIVTNKPEFLTLPLVDALGWNRRAKFVISGDTLPLRKPDPAPVLLACELAGVPPGLAVMVGDDPRDLEAGEAAGTHVALAGYGYGAREVLDSSRPRGHVIDSPLDLLDLLGLTRASQESRQTFP